jgi:hypothetical protein
VLVSRRPPLSPIPPGLPGAFFALGGEKRTLAMVNDEWIAAGGAGSIRPQAVAEALRIAINGVGKE